MMGRGGGGGGGKKKETKTKKEMKKDRETSIVIPNFIRWQTSHFRHCQNKAILRNPWVLILVIWHIYIETDPGWNSLISDNQYEIIIK